MKYTKDVKLEEKLEKEFKKKLEEFSNDFKKSAKAINQKNEKEISIESKDKNTIEVIEEINKLEELKEENDNISIFEYIKKEIINDYLEINNIEKSLDVTKDDSILKEKLEELKEETEIIIYKLDSLKNNDDENKEETKEDINDINNNEDIVNLLEKVEENKIKVSVLKTITTKEKIDIFNNEEKLKEDNNINDYTYDINNIENTTKEIAYLTNNLNDQIINLQNKTNEVSNITTKAEKTYKLSVNIDKVLSAIIMTKAAKTLPQTPIGRIAKIFLITSAINNMTNTINKKENVKVTKTINYIDFSKEFKDCKKDLDSISDMIELSIVQITKLKLSLEKNLTKYSNSIEYKEMLNKINEISDYLQKQNNNIKQSITNIDKKTNKSESKQYVKEYKNNA